MRGGKKITSSSNNKHPAGGERGLEISLSHTQWRENTPCFICRLNSTQTKNLDLPIWGKALQDTARETLLYFSTYCFTKVTSPHGCLGTLMGWGGGTLNLCLSIILLYLHTTLQLFLKNKTVSSSKLQQGFTLSKSRNMHCPGEVIVWKLLRWYLLTRSL